MAKIARLAAAVQCAASKAAPGARARTAEEKRFLALGEVAAAFLTGAAAAGVANMPR
jgi:hypothetical protein